MTTLQKERIKILRNGGNSYFKIAAALGLSENTVKSHCRRNKIDAVNSIANIIKTYDGLCGNCNKPVFYTAGAKKKRFCSDKCRMAWWNAHPEAVSRKTVYRFVCLVCKTDFESYGNAKRKYCSRACFGLSRRACHE